MNTQVPAGAGFFGKVTSHGDFVARRLPHEFQQPWDLWLQAALSSSRAQLGAAWLPTYLSSPLWRFALAPGVCGEQGWAGVLMPSVDRVGRHFPLTIAAPVTGGMPSAPWLSSAAPWYEQLEDLALCSLGADFSLENFDQALMGVSTPAGASVLTAGAVGNRVYALESAARLDAALAALVFGARGTSLWWTDGSDRLQPCVMQCDGLPGVARFAAMLDGQWALHGWQL